MPRQFDHIDLRVRNMAETKPFYDVLLPALGFTHDAKIAGWVQYEAVSGSEAPVFFGLTESRHIQSRTVREIRDCANKTHGEQIILKHLGDVPAIKLGADEVFIGCDCKATSHDLFL